MAGKKGNAGGAGSPLPAGAKTKLEGLFGADFSDVRIHNNSARMPAGATAYTTGSDIHIASGKYHPDTKAGMEILGHEMAHVVQQRQGRVKLAPGSHGLNINADPALEAEAEAMGKKAAEL